MAFEPQTPDLARVDEALTVMLVIPAEVERARLQSIIESDENLRIVAQASDGTSALSLAQESNPEVAIIESPLPDTDALGLVHLLGLKGLTPQVLLYTDQNGRDFVISAVREGVRAFVLKSQAQHHLLPALKALADNRPYWEDAVDDNVLDELLQRGPPPPPSTLSRREWQVLRLAAEGHSSKEMASALGASIETIETDRTRLRRKLGFRSRAELIRYAALPRTVPD
jgi:DNA-binding NarL/FixJ family response regulator